MSVTKRAELLERQKIKCKLLMPGPSCIRVDNAIKRINHYPADK